MRSGCRFGVILHTERGEPFVPQTFAAPVIQVDMRKFQILRKIPQCIIVILTGNRHFSGQQVFHGVVAAVMSEFQPSALRAARQSQQLMTQTDPHHRNFVQQRANIFHCITDCRRVCRTVGKENAVRMKPKDFGGRRSGGNNGNLHILCRQLTKDIVFHPPTPAPKRCTRIPTES